MKLSNIGVTGNGSISTGLINLLGCSVFNPNQSWDLVVHADFNNDIVACEENMERAMIKNFRGTVEKVTWCYENQVPLLLISSEHVFGESWPFFGRPNEKTVPGPLNNYGHTMLAAEVTCHTDLETPMKIVRVPVTISYIPEVETLLTILGSKKHSSNITTLPRLVDQLDYYFWNYDSMPKVLHLGGDKMFSIAECYDKCYELRGSDLRFRDSSSKFHNIHKRGGLDVSLAKSFDFPMADMMSDLEVLWELQRAS